MDTQTPQSPPVRRRGRLAVRLLAILVLAGAGLAIWRVPALEPVR